jgi:uncharacterized OB-fold protein
VTTMPDGRPIPDTDDPVFAEYWAGMRRGVCQIRRCQDCGTGHWPPRALCPSCQSFGIVWEPVPPAGTLYTWTVVGHQTTPGMIPPYIIGLVELDEAPGVRLVGNIVNCDPGALTMGHHLVGLFDEIQDGVTVMNWEPARVSGRPGPPAGGRTGPTR